MNCYIVEMEKKSDYYSAKFIDGNNYDKNGVCDLNKLQENNEHVSIQVSNNSEIIGDTSNWLKGNVSLKALTDNTLVIDCTNNRCVWTSSSGTSSVGDNYTISNISGILETRYTFQYTVYDNNTSEVKRYKSSVNLKIDNESPVLYLDEFTVSDRFVNTSTKKVKIVASDGNGSGIEGYYLSLDNGQLCNSTSIVDEYQNSNTFTVDENGAYLVCVKDKVGNVSSATLKINYIS